MKYLFLLPIFFLQGCILATVPPFPNALEELNVACPAQLMSAPDNTTLSDLLTVVNENYTTYYKCSAKVEGWINWYKEQKIKYEEITKK